MAPHRPPRTTPDPRGCERSWLAQGARSHLVALLVLAIATLLLYHRTALHPRPVTDESIYAEAAAAVAGGESPYRVPGYYYPAAFAFAWAGTDAVLGPVPSFAFWRFLNFAAAVALAWLAGLYVPAGLSLRGRLAVAIPLLAAPGMALGLRHGNVSILTAVLVTGGVLLAGRWWLLAGLLLGSSVAIKPLALPALVVLAAPRRHAERDFGAGLLRLASEQRAALLGLAVAAAMLIPVPYLTELLAQPVEDLTRVRTVSVFRLLDLLGLSLPRLPVLAALYAAFALAALGARTRVERAVLALVAAMVAAPVVWPHTMVLGLPFLVLAVAAFWPDLRPARDAATPGEPRRRLVALAVWALVALQLGFQAGGFDLHPVPVQIAFCIPILAAPPVTAALLFRRLRRDG
ncbi:MAG TPA: hypothetical protein VMV46_06845 [Thermoanaerobaculia bacterium]|nr:hypothetical protein [Thermoanaerobaculia bacterium]